MSIKRHIQIKKCSFITFCFMLFVFSVVPFANGSSDGGVTTTETNIGVNQLHQQQNNQNLGNQPVTTNTPTSTPEDLGEDQRVYMCSTRILDRERQIDLGYTEVTTVYQDPDNGPTYTQVQNRIFTKKVKNPALSKLPPYKRSQFTEMYPTARSFCLTIKDETVTFVCPDPYSEQRFTATMSDMGELTGMGMHMPASYYKATFIDDYDHSNTTYNSNSKDEMNQKILKMFPSCKINKNYYVHRMFLFHAPDVMNKENVNSASSKTFIQYLENGLNDSKKPGDRLQFQNIQGTKRSEQENKIKNILNQKANLVCKPGVASSCFQSLNLKEPVSIYKETCKSASTNCTKSINQAGETIYFSNIGLKTLSRLQINDNLALKVKFEGNHLITRKIFEENNLETYDYATIMNANLTNPKQRIVGNVYLVELIERQSSKDGYYHPEKFDYNYLDPENRIYFYNVGFIKNNVNVNKKENKQSIIIK